MYRVIAILAAAIMLMGFQAPALQVGQVWSYDTRPKDAGSLLKIQKISQKDGQPVYHISLIGVRVGGKSIDVHHMPFTAEALNESINRLVADPGRFPDAEDAIAQWRKADGGVFTIRVKSATELLEQSLTTGK